MAYRNPSPPPEFDRSCDEDKDQITETVLSKSWLLSVMVKIVEDTKYRRTHKQVSAQPLAAGKMVALTNGAYTSNIIACYVNSRNVALL